MSFLDLLSTSQTKKAYARRRKPKNDPKIYDLCQNGAPYFAYQIEGKKWGVVQGCCNDWNCPRCGQQRAKEEYGRIVQGAREIGANNSLYMLTITCLGAEMSLEDAEANYLVWTNRLLSRLRVSTIRRDKVWAYASVTERQSRKHPHSHYITTYCPTDTIFIAKGQPKTYCTSGEVFPAKHDTLQSFSLERACVECGLGRQYDISGLGSVEGASRYVAKYLFKASVFDTVWPKGWRRVRYSQNWPKLPEKETESMILLTALDWLALAKKAVRIITKEEVVRQKCQWAIGNSDVIIQ